MKIKAQKAFIAVYHVFASLVFGGFTAVGIYWIVQYVGTDNVVGGIVMTTQFGLFFSACQVLAFLYYAKAKRYPVIIENGLVTIQSYKRGKTLSFPVSEVSNWGFIRVRDGSKGIVFFTKDGGYHVVSPIVTPSREDRAKIGELLGVKELL
jgi:hypothetical protein